MELTMHRYTKTSLMKPHIIDILLSKGIEFADIADCTLAVLRVACDLGINGIDLQINHKEVSLIELTQVDI